MNNELDQLESEPISSSPLDVLESQLVSRNKSLQRTLDIYEKLKDKQEKILANKKKVMTASMLTAISNNLINQLKMERQHLKNISKELDGLKSEGKDYGEGIEGSYEGNEVNNNTDMDSGSFTIPFPVKSDGSITSYGESDVAERQEEHAASLRPTQEDFLKPIELPL